MDNLELPFVFHQKVKIFPMNDSITLKGNDRVTFLINLRRKKEADEWFEKMDGGFHIVEKVLILRYVVQTFVFAISRRIGW